jgi:hypothetical protein
LLARGSKSNTIKETTANMLGKKNIFIGWVDLSPDEWSVWGYESKAEWGELIKEINLDLQKNLQSKYLTDRTVTGAKDRNDENAAGNDLYIKFADVKIDENTYDVSLSIHFLDPTTNSDIASIPVRTYLGGRGGFERHVRSGLDRVAEKVGIEVMATAPGK